MVKLLIGEMASNRGQRCSCNALSISHDEGFAPGVKSEKVRWYVGAYFAARVIRRATSAAPSPANGLFSNEPRASRSF